MHLISPLISGVANAGNGSALICRRGSTVLATLYSSFEGDSFASSSLDSNDRLILDSYGRCEVYVNDLCDVHVYDADGTLQISFTAGYSAAGIEVRSGSFTGSEYDFSAANQRSLPTTLQAVLDLWYSTRAMTDWALPSATQPFVIVTDDAYGAKGDNVTDDTVSIQAAIAAAGQGGVVFFPTGTYRTTGTLHVTHSGVTLVGVGASRPEGSTASQLSEIRVDSSSSSVITLSAGVSLVTVTGLALGSAQANTATLVDLPLATSIALRYCWLGGDHSTGHLVTLASGVSLAASHTGFSVGGATASAIHTVSADASIDLDRCGFTSAGVTYSGDGLVYGNNIRAWNCGFSPGHLLGTLACIKFNSGAGLMSGIVSGCTFSTASFSGTGDVVGMDLATPSFSSTFIESGNRFPIANQYETLAFTAYVYGFTLGVNIQLRSRDTRVLFLSDNSASITLPLDQYGTVILQTTNAAVTFDGDRGYNGSQGQVFIYHPSGGAGTATPSSKFFGGTAATTANTSTHCWQYVCTMVNATLRFMVVVDARACGNGA